ncbi:hypothetical protein CFK40_15125 [Virgibacillus necropolis]|uniref:Uncharacterized protein n=1 Tax=Virgibacillus necropolis TaxID=163877 RepID=A0A221MF05_9BACI|nr:hypothetical protein CFK40_15125 [Virgibacillus necropolis]
MHFIESTVLKKKALVTKSLHLKYAFFAILVSIILVIDYFEPTFAHLYSYVAPNGFTWTPSIFGETSCALEL